jgi:RimJ/RimL family protein N-acetyltransferase
MLPNTQPSLHNEQVRLLPLQAADFADLYAAARDPKIWEQHPNQDRWQPEAFRTYFEGALQQGALKIVDQATGTVIGSTRFYGYDAQADSILIGYTFLTTRYWGTGLNTGVKTLMLDYIFQFVSTVYFHIGAENRRSQLAIGRLGAEKVGEEQVAYFGEPPKLNFVYRISREAWLSR